MIGPDVTELLPELTLAQLWDLTAEEVARNVHAHPALRGAQGSSPRRLRPHDQLLALGWLGGRLTMRDVALQLVALELDLVDV